MNAYATRHGMVHGIPSAETGMYEILESKDLLNYFKKLERAFRRDVGDKDEEGYGIAGTGNAVKIAVESSSSLVWNTTRQNCGVEHPRLFQKSCRRHPRKIKAEPNVRPATNFRIREGWSEGDIERLRKTDSGYHRLGTYREGSSLPLFAAETFPYATCEQTNRTESRDTVAFRLIVDGDDRIAIADRFSRVFPIVDDLNSSEILRYERLLREERDREDPFQFSKRPSVFPGNDVGAKELHGTSTRTRRRVNARHDHRREGEPGQKSKKERKEKPAPCQLVNTRRCGRRERFDGLRETDKTSLLRHRIEEYPCPCRKIVDAVQDRPWNRNGDDRVGGGAESPRFSKEMTQRRTTRDIDWRKRGRNTRKARDDRKSPLKTSRAKSCEQATCSEHARSTLHRFDSCCHVESVRETATSESDATCCSCGSRRAAFHLDADDSARQLGATRCRKCASVRSTTATHSRLFESRNRRTATGRHERRSSNCRESFRAPVETTVSDKKNKMNSRVAKPKDSTGKVHLKKVLVYPPRGQEGPPLTLYKSSSNIDCVVKGNPRVGFRYDVTYVQKFQSSAWCPNQNSRQ